jgi:serine/threonine protein kinase/formylglycine-generating enzyme required for sulfatase activity/dienelactone hydrolase
MIGKTVSHYEVLEELGGGGMGVVFKARDLKLDRFVALKFLPAHVASEAQSNRFLRERFVQEAKASSALDHPNIGVIHEIGETEEGETFIAMGYYEGENLRQRIERGPLPLEEAISIVEQIARGLAEAHKHGIVHRDIKPANLIVTPDGGVKIIDFGLAKLQEVTRMTRQGAVLGTPSYMSPEQARGDEVDARTDLWSLGVVLYEMLTGRLPFRGGNESAVIHSILHELPRPARELREDIPAALERVVIRALEKDMDRRYGSADELRKDLASPSSAPAERTQARKFTWVALAACGILLGLLGVLLIQRNARVRWAREQAIPEIQRLVKEGNYVAAFAQATQAEHYIATDPTLGDLWSELSTQLSLETTPTGADVYFRPYDSDSEDWDYLGQTPITGRRIPRGNFRWRVEKGGFRTLERAQPTGFYSEDYDAAELTLIWQLEDEGKAPSEMVPVPGGEIGLWITALDHLPKVDLPDYWIDRREVTNREFQAFVDSGGYQKRQYWKEPFIKEGRELSWDEALTAFRDATGRPGPSSWELGRYPKGKDDHPVSGVSWFEAAAYARFAGKQLPTAYHWSEAAGTMFAAYVIPQSNIEARSQGIAAVGSWPGMSTYGAYDMAGNVREWCWNEGRNGKRLILGGAWNEPSYLFVEINAQSPWDRSPVNGFRCIKNTTDSPLSDQATGPLLDAFRDYTEEKPVSNEIFRVYKSLYSYDKTPLKASVESIDETTEAWEIEKVSFDAVYGGERVTAYLFIPKRVKPPYQAVVCFPGSNAIYDRSFQTSDIVWFFDFLVESGRALMFPIYKGTYERGDNMKSDYPDQTSSYRAHVIEWSNDLGRSIDYLETRGDIDPERLAFYGVSWGASQPQLLAVENRFKVAVLYSGGFYFTKTLPEVDAINFAPWVTLPLLMLNGRSDFLYPVETSQEPLYRMLGTPGKDKRRVLFDASHALPRNEVIRESLDWLDRHLGPVE